MSHDKLQPALTPEQQELFKKIVAADSSIATLNKRISLLRTRLRSHLEAYYRKASDIQMQIAYCQKRIGMMETYIKGDIIKGRKRKGRPSYESITIPTIQHEQEHPNQAAP